MGIIYTNRAITTEQQIDVLKERGLIIDDVERAIKVLDTISFFVLQVIGDILRLTILRIRMGTLSKLYSNFSDATAKHAVAREFGLNHHKFLRSWLECLAVLRNCCAHHSRITNRVFPVKPKMPERMPNTWIADFSFREQTLYPQLCCVVYWLNSIIPENTFITDFKQLLINHPSVKTNMLGFPRNWEQESLWRQQYLLQ